MPHMRRGQKSRRTEDAKFVWRITIPTALACCAVAVWTDSLDAITAIAAVAVVAGMVVWIDGTKP